MIDFKKYSDLKKSGAITLVREANGFSITQKRFDSELGHELDPVKENTYRPEQLITQIETKQAELDGMKAMLEDELALNAEYDKQLADKAK